MTKGDNGVWTVTLGPIDPGAYRYNFNVDGVTVIDPRNSAISESNTNVWSLVVVPGSDVFDTKQVPHGAVAAVTYYSTALAKFRRMHVYTPPVMRPARKSIRFSICSMAPETATKRGRRSGARVSFWTI
jgi:enterochelin esterase family protein